MPPRKKAVQFKAPQPIAATREPHTEATALGMIGHLQIPVTNVAKSIEFYDKALAPLGYSRWYSDDVKKSYAYGPPSKFVLWICQKAKHSSKLQGGNRYPGLHFCITAPSRRAVHEFHEAATANGGLDEGAPSIKEFTPSYYAAFAMDPDGWKLEVVYKGEATDEDAGLEAPKSEQDVGAGKDVGVGKDVGAEKNVGAENVGVGKDVGAENVGAGKDVGAEKNIGAAKDVGVEKDAEAVKDAEAEKDAADVEAEKVVEAENEEDEEEETDQPAKKKQRRGSIRQGRT
ncbi:hypothetical protein SeMB42_g00383 [Synchytrium endobioticum]|uniref:VOC domain-containing protein n=1 Tax=Synchytrium endobioticum TaxID=286115 RepID=A0A507DR44_9FUNG|nr:hypothetical protein SeMB42_g00383 [Synchytrium endobioticum]